MQSRSFERFAGLCAILAGLAGFFYAVAFIIISRSDPELSSLLSALFLMLGGLFSTPALVAIYGRLRETDESFALWALLLSILGALGSAIHGGYDLANSINPPELLIEDMPNQVDPRGLLTFGLIGIALFVIAGLIRRGGQLPKSLSSLGFVSALLLIVLYLGRLIILDPTRMVIVGPALLEGFVINPLWYIWLGLALMRG